MRRLKILVCPDKFKSSLTSREACNAIEAGLTADGFEVITFPLADGGEGTSEILLFHTRGHKISLQVHDPLFRTITASYGISSDGVTAFIDMSAASGLHLLNAGERNAMHTTTLGTGELVADAINRGVTNIILGIGGSATNDGGIGAASALGYEFLDEEGIAISPVGAELGRIRNIRRNKINPYLRKIHFTAICDVDNPLTGTYGAAHVYAPQKGATPQQVQQLDAGLENLADVIHKDIGVDIERAPGAGAGGGFGGGAMAFFNASLRRGVDVVFEVTDLETHLRQADVIITGEGKIDNQTLHGKLVAGITALASKYAKRVLVVAGKNDLDQNEIKEAGIEKVFALSDYVSETESMNNAYNVLRQIAEQHVASYLKK